MSNCPDCRKILVNAEKCSNCGWIKRTVSKYQGNSFKFTRNDADAQCKWIDGRGHQCQLEGWMSDGTTGGGPWYCSPHFFARREGKSTTSVSDAEGRSFADNLRQIVGNRGLVQEEPGANG